MLGERTHRFVVALGIIAAAACGLFSLRENGSSVLGLVSIASVAVGIILLFSLLLTPMRTTPGGVVFICVGALLVAAGGQAAIGRPVTPLSAVALVGISCAVGLIVLTLVAAAQRSYQTREDW